MDHIELARWADLALVCPATANTINRLAAGLGNDPVGTLFLAWELRQKPWWIAPAMNHAMLAHPATQASLARLAAMGAKILTSEPGALACGEEGEGRMPEPEKTVAEVLGQLLPGAK